MLGSKRDLWEVRVLVENRKDRLGEVETMSEMTAEGLHLSDFLHVRTASNFGTLFSDVFFVLFLLN